MKEVLIGDGKVTWVEGQNLNKENFWNVIEVECPITMAAFKKWLDAYKEIVGWNFLFNFGHPNGKKMGWHSPKFHDIPFEMQIGIVFTFFNEVFADNTGFTFYEGFKKIDVVLWICQFFESREEAILDQQENK